jgi:CelD/BcsL family acetyltransferase involved in cellulose biosynthesis
VAESRRHVAFAPSQEAETLPAQARELSKDQGQARLDDARHGGTIESRAALQLCGEADIMIPREEANPRPAPHDLILRAYSSGELSAVEPKWRDLEQKCGAGLMFSWAWTSIWLRHYGAVVPHRFLIAERGGAPCGAVLLAESVGRKIGPFRWNTIHLGTAGEAESESVVVEYNGLLALPEEKAAFAAAIMRHLHADPGWDELLLEGFIPEDAQTFFQAEPRFQTRERQCPAVDLEAVRKTGGGAQLLFKTSVQKKIRYNIKGLGPARGEWAETLDQAMDIFEELVALHHERWHRVGQPGAFASTRFHAFHKEAIAQLLPNGKASLFRVKNATDTLGCIYSFLDGPRVMVYQTGMLAMDSNKYSPGWVVHLEAIQACTQRGFGEYNYLAGDTQYKRELSTLQTKLHWASYSRPRLRREIVEALRPVKRKVVESLRSVADRLRVRATRAS